MKRVVLRRPPAAVVAPKTPGRAPLSLPLSPLVVATAVLAGVLAYVVLRNGAWVYDDNLILVLARSFGFSWHWLDQPIFQHWDPAMNATFSVMVHLFPFDYRWGLVALLVVLGLATLVFERVIGLVIGRGWVSLGLAAWFGLSMLWTRQLQWWTSGLQQLPALLCELICLYAFLRFYDDGSGRWIVASAVALGVGLLFYEKPAVMLVYLALIRVLLMSDHRTLRGLFATFWRERRLWLAYCGVVGIWAIGYVSSGAFGAGRSGRVGLDQYLSYFHIMWINTLAPALAGFTLPAADLSVVQTIAAALLQLVLIGLLAVSVHRKRAAWRAWAFIAIVVLLDGGLVALSRVAQFGTTIGNDLRYLTDFAWLIPFALCVAFSDDRLLRTRVGEPKPRISLDWPTRRLSLGAGLLLVTYAVGSAATAARLQVTWGSVQARHWENNVQRGFAQLARGHVRPVVADQPVPFQIISYTFAPLNRLSQVLPIYAGSVQVDGPLDGRLVTIDQLGNISAAVSTGAIGDGTTSRLLRAHRLLITGGAVTGRAGRTCVAAGARPVQIERHLTGSGTGARPYYLDLSYSTLQPFALPVLEDTGAGYPGVASASIVVGGQTAQSIAWLDAGLPRRVKLILPPHRALCLKRMDIVRLRTA